MLKPRWMIPPWISVAVSGVSHAGTAPSTAGPVTRAGTKPPRSVAQSERPSASTINHAAIVIPSSHMPARGGGKRIVLASVR